MVPRECRPITVGGQVVGIACGTRRNCSTPGCAGRVALQCDYPVTRRGTPATCDRYICQACAFKAGPDVDYCAAHGRAHQAQP